MRCKKYPRIAELAEAADANLADVVGLLWFLVEQVLEETNRPSDVAMVTPKLNHLAANIVRAEQVRLELDMKRGIPHEQVESKVQAIYDDVLAFAEGLPINRYLKDLFEERLYAACGGESDRNPVDRGNYDADGN